MVKINKINRYGFTLLELMIVMTILGVLTSMISGNFLTTIKKGRDARRKADLEQMQRAIEIYYEDKNAYPTGTLPFGMALCETGDCQSTEKIYMQKMPVDPKPEYDYLYNSDGTYYTIYSCLENDQDQGSGVNQSGYAGTNCGTCRSDNLCRYGVGSSNTNP